MIGYFIILVSSLVVQRQSNEIAVLRSRGASRMQVLGVYLLEGLLIGVVALGVGLLLAQAAALAMTWTRSFLTLAPTEVLPIDLTPEAWQRGLQMLGLLLLASLLPAFGAARYTVVSYKSERARDTKRPFWQRAYIDLLLLIPVYYGYSQLKERGTVAILGFGGGAADPFSNPLLLLAPTLYIFALALVVVRLFPLAMRAAGLGAQPPAGRLDDHRAALSLAHAARLHRADSAAGADAEPGLLHGLDGGNARLAYVRSGLLRCRRRYARARFWARAPSRRGRWAAAAARHAAEAPKDAIDEAKYLFLPVSEYLTIPGVTAATRVARSSVDATVANRRTTATFIGVDRADFPQIARWRSRLCRRVAGRLDEPPGRRPEQPAGQQRFRGQAGPARRRQGHARR